MGQKLIFEKVYQHYKTFPPLLFKETGPNYKNTCAVRLADAITRVVPDFFESSKLESWHDKIPTGHYVPSENPLVRLKFQSVSSNRDLPIRAGDIADYLEKRLGAGIIVSSKQFIERKKGIIFFKWIPGYGGTGHITLWDQDHCVDGGEYWESKQVKFWKL